MARTLYQTDPSSLHGSKSARMLGAIRRDLDIKDAVFRERRRNEEILSLAYQDGTKIASASEVENLRENALNLPYRYVRWFESQATSKRVVIKVSRDAGAGQAPSGPSDSDTGMWTAKTLERALYEAGFTREMKAVIGEALPRGTSVMAIGYHEQVITGLQSAEVGKDAQSVVTDVLGQGDLEAKEGQAHDEISKGLATQAQDPLLQQTIGMEGTSAILMRKQSHDQAAYEEETSQKPLVSTRLTRRRVWIQKRRVGEDVGWSPTVYDTEDTGFWWDRHVETVAYVKASPLFSKTFKDKVKGYDARTSSGVSRGGKTLSDESMGSDARQAQSEEALEDDEKFVEFFVVWCRRPDMLSGGIRKIVCAECPEEFVEASDENPHVYPPGHPYEGQPLIPGFYPFYDFTPYLPSLPIPERTLGVPPVSVGMPQFEQIAELGRLLHESALRHSLRLYQIDPGLKDAKKIQDALKNGVDGFAFIADSGMVDSNGNIREGVKLLQFSGNTLDIERLYRLLEGNWIKMMAMPPAVLQGVGTAGTASQDQMGLAAGERESGALLDYFQQRMADVCAGLRGLIRGCYDDEDFVALLGETGAKVMKAWQTGTTDEGDIITFTFGATAEAEKTVERKQLMEAISVLSSQVEPVTGLPKYDVSPLIDELCRSLGIGEPKLDATPMRQLQMMVLQLQAQAQAMNPQGPGGQSTTGSSGRPNESTTKAGPNPSEGDGPTSGNLNAGARRGSVPINAGG